MMSWWSRLLWFCAISILPTTRISLKIFALTHHNTFTFRNHPHCSNNTALAQLSLQEILLSTAYARLSTPSVWVDYLCGQSVTFSIFASANSIFNGSTGSAQCEKVIKRHTARPHQLHSSTSAAFRSARWSFNSKFRSCISGVPNHLRAK